MPDKRETKYAFKNAVGSTVMLLDNLDHAKRWYKSKADLFGPMMPTYTLHKQTITETLIELPNV